MMGIIKRDPLGRPNIPPSCGSGLNGSNRTPLSANRYDRRHKGPFMNYGSGQRGEGVLVNAETRQGRPC